MGEFSGNDINRITYAVQTPASGEVVPCELLRSFLRLDDDSDDALLTMYVKAAVSQVEKYIGFSILDTVYKMRIDYFPENDAATPYPIDYTGEGYVYTRRRFWPENDIIEFLYKPLKSVNSVTTYDDANNGTVFSASNYTVDTMANRLVLNVTSQWPVNLRRRAAVEVLFTAGYGTTAETVPSDLQIAILQMAAKMYNCRGVIDVSDMMNGLISAYKDYFFTGVR